MPRNLHAHMEKPFYTRIALLGVAMYIAVELVILATTLAFLPRRELWYPLFVGGLASPSARSSTSGIPGA